VGVRVPLPPVWVEGLGMGTGADGTLQGALPAHALGGAAAAGRKAGLVAPPPPPLLLLPLLLPLLLLEAEALRLAVGAWGGGGGIVPAVAVSQPRWEGVAALSAAAQATVPLQPNRVPRQASARASPTEGGGVRGTALARAASARAQLRV
jgi:hypothetical protein